MRATDPTVQRNGEPHQREFRFVAQSIERVLIAAPFLVLAGPAILFTLIWLLDAKRFDTATMLIAVGAWLFLLFVVANRFIHRPETVVIGGDFVRSSNFGQIALDDVDSYRLSAVDYPPKVRLTLKSGKKVRFAVRPQQMNFSGTDDESTYIEFVDCLLDWLESGREPASPGKVADVLGAPMGPREQEPVLPRGFLLGVIGVLTLVGLVAAPSKMIIAMPVLAAAAAAVLAQKSWRARRSSSAKTPKR